MVEASLFIYLFSYYLFIYWNYIRSFRSITRAPRGECRINIFMRQIQWKLWSQERQGAEGLRVCFVAAPGEREKKKQKTDGAATLKILKLGTCSWTSRSSGMEIAQSDNNERRCVRFPAEITFVDGSLSANLSFSTPGFVFCVFIDIWFDPTVLKVCQVNVLAEIKVGRQLVCGCDSHWPTKMRFRTGSKGASYGRGRGKSLWWWPTLTLHTSTNS